LRDNLRIPFVRLSDNFLQAHGLAYKPEMVDFRGVNFEVKTQPAYASMAKIAEVEKGAF
jgi:hypothetical protein